MLPILLVAWRASASTQFVGRDADAVVAHAAQLGAAFFDLDLDRAGARVETVLDQFLDHGRRALDDLAGRDLVH